MLLKEKKNWDNYVKSIQELRFFSMCVLGKKIINQDKFVK